ncbi:Uncharacterised protein g2581 [Pycnogonum litorale]
MFCGCCKLFFLLIFYFTFGHREATKLGSRCRTNGECKRSVSVSFCHKTKRICMCSSYYVQHVNQCLKKVPLGRRCQLDLECQTKNSKCENRVCLCSENYRRSNDYCESKGSGIQTSTLLTVIGIFLLGIVILVVFTFFKFYKRPISLPNYRSIALTEILNK